MDSGGRVPHVQSDASLRHEYAHACGARATHARGLAVFAQPCCISIVVFLFLPNLGRDSNDTIFDQFFCKRFKLRTIPVLSVNGSRRHIRRIRYICILPVSHVQPSSASLCSSACKTHQTDPDCRRRAPRPRPAVMVGLAKIEKRSKLNREKGSLNRRSHASFKTEGLNPRNRWNTGNTEWIIMILAVCIYLTYLSSKW